jgi:hypothetical protein
MPLDPNARPAEAERTELERVIEASLVLFAHLRKPDGNQAIVARHPDSHRAVTIAANKTARFDLISQFL